MSTCKCGARTYRSHLARATTGFGHVYSGPYISGEEYDLSPAQRHALKTLAADDAKYDRMSSDSSPITGIRLTTMQALERRGLAEVSLSADGFWLAWLTDAGRAAV